MITYVGIDNGVSGSIGIISVDYQKGTVDVQFLLTPVKQELSYQKSKTKMLTRVDYKECKKLFQDIKDKSDRIILALERPMLNPQRYQASLSARASLEAMLILFEELDIPYSFLDSKEWQKAILPAGIKGSDEQKKASMGVGCRLFPEFKEVIQKHKDADGLLIAEFLHKKGL